MNTRSRNYLIAAIVALALLALFLPAFAQADPSNSPGAALGTNAPPAAADSAVIPATLKPLLDLLGAKNGTWLTAVIIWVMTLSTLFAGAAVWIQRKLRQRLLDAAASSDENDDVYILRILNNPVYQFLAFVLGFISIYLPTRAEFDDALKTKPGKPTVFRSLLLAFLLPFACFNTAMTCAPLDPNARPVVVRTEQVSTDAAATFQFVVNLDNANRAWWKANVPQFHQFAEQLRVVTPVGYNGGFTNLPRWAAALWSLEQIKEAYKAGSVSSNDLATATATISAMLSEANNWVTVTATNHAPVIIINQ